MSGSKEPTPTVLGQGPGNPWLTLEPGGKRQTDDPSWPQRSPVCAQPVYLSFMTCDIKDARANVRDANFTVLQDSVHHADWGSTDIVGAERGWERGADRPVPVLTLLAATYVAK